MNSNAILSITGLGYVGLPLALAFSKEFDVIAFDSSIERIEQLKKGIDASLEVSTTNLISSNIQFTFNASDLFKANFHIVCVPTDIDVNNIPNLNPLILASKTIGQVLKKGDIVVYESTVYPGCTEEDCVPVLESISGLKAGIDFKYGYSPERIVPGEKTNTLTKIKKIVSGNDAAALQTISAVYGKIITAGLHQAPSVKVAEAAKVIENTQRDLNISLMNELAIIFDTMEIDTHAVIEAASTKWNFQKYYPGLVGGHCISVDPYYLLHKAKTLGITPQVIAAGREVNNNLPIYIAKKIVQKLIEAHKNPGECNVLVLGVTFKENVSDIRNSKVFTLINELQDFGVQVTALDPYANSEQVFKEYGVVCHAELDLAFENYPSPITHHVLLKKFDAIVLAVAHDQFKTLSIKDLEILSKDELILFDLKGVLKDQQVKNYWRL